MIQSFLLLIMSVLTIAGGSLVWPKLTDKPRPAPLEQIHQMVIKTRLGEQAAQVLGVSDEQQPVEPVNVTTFTNGIAQYAATTLEKRAQDVVITQALRQVVGQFDKLSPEQQGQIRAALCSPVASTSGKTSE